MSRRAAARTGPSRRVAVPLLAVAVLAGCTGGGKDSSPTTTGPGAATTTSSPGRPTAAGQVSTLALRLSDGAAGPGDQPIALVAGEPLADPAAVLDRLPDLPAEPTAEPFAWPARTLTPPRPGATVQAPFPAATEQPAPAPVSTAPTVVRHQPDGEVDIAPFVTVTFDQPMVPIAALDELATATVPASVTAVSSGAPELTGEWSWIGTRTLRFDAAGADRLPMATEYRVVVPAGTAGVGGVPSTEPFEFGFTTPPVTVRSLAPTGESLSREPVFVATFDQRVDPAAVIAAVSVTAGDSEVDVRAATEAEIDADETARRTAAQLPEGRWVAFRPSAALPTDAAITVSFPPGTPSAEGPLTTTEGQRFEARTYGPLRLDRTSCGGTEECPPGGWVSLSFTNELDAAAFDASMVDVTPEVAGLSRFVSGSSIELRGAFLPGSTYEVTIEAGLTDVFGQTLGEPERIELRIGEAEPAILPFDLPLTTLDPAAAPALALRTVNRDDVRVRVFAVEPTQWDEFSRFALAFQTGDTAQSQAPGWEVLSDATVATDADGGQTETLLDLSDQLDGRRHVAVLVEPTETLTQESPQYWSNRPTATWVQRTSIGLDAFLDTSRVLAWTTDLSTGAPRADIAVGFEGAATTPTDERGVATLDLPVAASPVLVATSGDDSAILPAGYYGELFQRSERSDELRWYVFDDRGIYRPGEQVSVKGLVRRVLVDSDRALERPANGSNVTYVVRDPQYVEIGSGRTRLDANGGFDLTIDLPEGANLGYASLELTVEGVPGISYATYSHTFRVEEFRRPEFEVTARTESTGPIVSDTPVTVVADAAYYAGGPLGSAPVRWTVTTADASYRPPGWDEFAFGAWVPWWTEGGSRFAAASDVCCFPGPIGESEVEEWPGTTDGSGTHRLQIEVDDTDGRPDLPVTVTANAAVTDVNRQEFAATTDLLVHPASRYVGLRSDATFVDAGQPLEIDAIVTDIDGAVVPGVPVEVRAGRLESRELDGVWTEVEVDTETCAIVSAAEPVICSLPTAAGGPYRVTAVVTDDAGGRNRTELNRWVSGARTAPDRSIEQETVEIVPDGDEYAVGDTARFLLQAPFTGSALVTISRPDIVRTEVVELADGSGVLDVPIAEADAPGFQFDVEAVGAAPRSDDEAATRPAFATGSITVPVSLASRTLTVEATPAAETVEPGATTSLTVAVSGPDDAPTSGAHLTVVVADEAVLAVGGYQLPDPLGQFYVPAWSSLTSILSRSTVRLGPLPLTTGSDDSASGDTAAASETTAAAAESAADASAPAAEGSAASFDRAAGGGADASGGVIRQRSDFEPLAVFEPDVVTGADGTATIEVPLPDTLTRYRVMVVAAHGDDRFGFDDAALTARLPLTVRPSAPRFANFGDAFELPVVVQNQTDTALDVDVALRAANLLLDGPAGRRVSVPANDRIEVRFPVRTVSAGTAVFQVGVAGGGYADAATESLRVFTPATAEAVATYGVIDGGVVSQPVIAPTGAVPEFGGLEVTTSSTALQALTDAVLYLVDYPHENADGLAARIVAIAALRDVLDAFDAAGLPAPAEIDAGVVADITALTALQNDDGGFPSWERNRRSEPYVSVAAAEALVAADAAGYPVSVTALDRATSYLANIESYLDPSLGDDARDAIIAAALNVRHRNGDSDAGRAVSLWNDRGDELPLDAIGWLWPVVTDTSALAEIEREVINRAVDTAGTVTFTSGYDDGASVLLASDQRTDAIVLSALLEESPESDLVPKVVAGLLDGRRAGRWDGAQANAAVLLALRRYFDVAEATAPDFVARLWLGDRFAGEQEFRERSTDRVELTVPTAELLATGNTDVVVQQEGSGRLYYRIGLRYAPANLDLDPLDRGFEVSRTYEAVDDPADVVRRPDGTWAVRAGARVRVRISMVAESERGRVALVDPLAAGLEILNPGLATTPEVVEDEPEPSPFGDWSWNPTWFEHQNQRDDRAEAYATSLAAGVYEYTYVARATTPGSFVVPPARAEEIDATETFGRSGTDRVVVS